MDRVQRETVIKICKGTVGSISKALRDKNEELLHKLLNPAMFRAGRKSVLSASEQRIIVKRAIYDSERGKAWTITDVRIAMGKVANDGRENQCKEIVPGASTLRQFRVDNPEITFSNKVNKEISKQRDESFEHVKTFKEVLSEIIADYPDTGKYPKKLWNMDETSIECEYGRKEKVACSSASNGSGSRISADGSGAGVHVTCVVAVSASGFRCPPFFIIQRKHPMSSWTDPAEGKTGEHLKNTVLERFTRENWFPETGVKVMSEKGSMTKRTLPYFMRHFNTFVRKHVPQDKKHLWTLDGHSSRKGMDWLEEASNNNMEICKAPANTSQVLQPCDQRVIKVIKSRVRRVRDQLAAAGMTNTKSVKIKLFTALAALDDLSQNDIRVSLAATGLWPMDMRFVRQFETPLDRLKVEATRSPEKQRLSDSATTEECRNILCNSSLAAEEKLRDLSILLKNRETVNNILMNLKSDNVVNRGCIGEDRNDESCRSTNVKRKNCRLDQGLTDMSPDVT